MTILSFIKGLELSHHLTQILVALAARGEKLIRWFHQSCTYESKIFLPILFMVFIFVTGKKSLWARPFTLFRSFLGALEGTHWSTGFTNFQPIKMHSTATQRFIVIG